ncbi:tyrosine-type recombinase/integrase [Sphingobacterium faecium]|uniref:tyrosine-type recombinase/integrase n=1 Tax=Sphingobacterium faecium TaxID=34087 RepID=UPI002479A78E|nr:site-specific integrase [Sphingobacterium faecium]WGQ15434.1 site-specific integrase [Sphingobacterium faecium]
MNAKKYKNARIIRASNGDWRIVYEFEHPDQPGVFKKFYVRDGINYVHDPIEKEKAAIQLQEDIDFALENGFDPFLPQKRIESQIFTEETLIKSDKDFKKVRPWSILQAITAFSIHIKKKNLAEGTIKKYESYFSVLKQWLDKSDQQNLIASEIHEDLINDFLDESFDDLSWSPRTYNNYLKFLCSFFNRVKLLEKRRIRDISYNIDVQFLEAKSSRAEKNKYYTKSVADIIKKELKKDLELSQYVRWIFYSCMRPKEIRFLKVENIDINARQIKVDGKTGYRFVPICDELLRLINEMNLANMPINYFVFGKGQKTSAVNITDDYFRDKYRPLKVKLNLNKNYTLYSWKHTRVVSLISAGFDDNQVMTLTGHRDRAGFEAYKRELVIDNSSMKGKTIDF